MSKARHNLRKNDRLEVVLESMAAGGQAVGHVDGVAIFVRRGAPGDRVLVELFDVRKDFAHAQILEVLEPGPARQEAPCKIFKVCGGCQWQHIKYSEQLVFKTDIVRQSIKRIGGYDDPHLVKDGIAGGEPLFYRNKVQFPVRQPKGSNRILAGYFKEGSHELVNVKHCPVQPEPVDELVDLVKTALETRGVSAYNEERHSGLVRHIACRYSFGRGEMLLTLVLNLAAGDYPSVKSVMESIGREAMDEMSGVRGVCVNFNTARGNRIMGDTTFAVCGEPFIHEEITSPALEAAGIGSIKFRLSPQSFFQVNSHACAVLFDQVFEAVDQYRTRENLSRVPLLIDAYGGTGTIGMWISSLCRRVLSIDEVPSAIEDGKIIVSENGIENVELRLGTVEELLPQEAARGSRPNIVVLDPPRSGASAECLSSIISLNPDRIIYVSCDPGTLSRDLKILAASGYGLQKVQPVDLFPQTYHVESVAVLDRV